MTSTPLVSRWDFKRKVLVYAPFSPGSPDSPTFLPAIVLISYDKETREGIISIQISLHKPNPACTSQKLTLAFPPKSVQNCSWIPKSNDHLCPARLLPKVPRCGSNVSDISTLSLQLNTMAELFVPHNMKCLTPHTESMSDFDTLERISQPGTIYIHFGKDQIPTEEIPRLQGFLRALRRCSVNILHLDLKRQRLVQSAWHKHRPPTFPPPYSKQFVFEQQELPAYRANSESEEVDEKWRPDSPPSLTENERRERQPFQLSQPLDSPTEVATPATVSTSSIDSPSPSPIRPTIFAHAPTRNRTHLERIAGLEHQLRGIPDHFIRRLLTKSGHGHLLARLEDSDIDLSYESMNACFLNDPPNNRDSIEDYVNATVKCSLQSHVNEIVDENRALLYDLLRDREEEFRSEVEEIYSGLRIKANECLHEFEETFQESIDQLEGRSQQCLDYIQDQGVTATEENIAKFRLSLRRYRHRRLRATRSGAPKNKFRMQRYFKRRRRC